MKKVFLSALLIVSFVVYTFNNLNDTNKIPTTAPITQAGDDEKITPYSDYSDKVEQKRNAVIERLLFEFNMLKDPATGMIPPGIREQELALARTLPTKESYNLLLKGDALNTYTALGPNNFGGRTRAFAYDLDDPTIMLSGGISSGMFRSTNSGTSWTKVTPSDEIHNVSCLAQDPRSGFHHIWYYGTGEGTGNSASMTGAFYRGHGIYKSTDNGLTWTRLLASNPGTLESFDHRNDYVYNIIVQPGTGDVFAASVNSIYKSSDGGSTWALVLGQGAGTFSSSMFTDIVAASDGRLYASFSGTAGTSDGGSGLPPSTALDGVWTSPTGAVGTWTKIAGTGSATLPAGWMSAGTYGRVVLAIAPSDEDIVYALYDNKKVVNCSSVVSPEADFFKWDAAATSWTNLSSTLPDESGCSVGNDPFAIQGGYDLCVKVKPDDKDFVIIGGTNAYRSTNAGATWTRIGGYAGTSGYSKYTGHHPDMHTFVFHPTDYYEMICGSDGGIHRTDDITASAVSWSSLNNDYVTYQYYHVTIDPATGSLHAIGGTQDNGTSYTTGTTTHTEIFSGDGVSVGISSGNTYHYVGFQNGPIYRRLSGASPFTGTAIKPSGSGSGIFVTYFLLDPDNTETLWYASSSSLYRTNSASSVSTTSGWTLMTGVGSSTGSNIRYMAVTRGTYTTSSKLYIGTEGGKVLRLDDPQNASASATPVDITGGSMPAAVVSGIAVDPTDDKKVMVTFSNYGVSSIWYTDDASVASPTWTAVEGNISLPSIRNCVIVNRLGYPTEYYVGTSVGLFSTTSLAGSSTVWVREGSTSIRYAVARHLAYRPADNFLLVGTHGNGMFYTEVPDPLPVELIAFSGQFVNGSVRLTWSTATEINNYGFEIERAVKQQNGFIPVNVWQKIGFVEGHGNSNSVKDYSFTDNNVSYGTYFYRLKQIDIDGSYHFSEAIEVQAGEIPGSFVLEQNYPNPFNPSTTIKFVTKEKTFAELKIFDSIGREAAMLFNGITDAGRVYSIEFDASSVSGGLASGIYYYRLKTDNSNLVKKMVLMR